MLKAIFKSNWFPYLAIFAVVVVYYLPIFLNPNLVLNRGNDLEEFFWPILNYVKSNILTSGVVPLWNTLFLAGTPLLPDPQSPIFYIPNLIALILPLDTFFITSFVLHSTVAGVAMYLCSKDGFKFSKTTSFLLATLYIVTPKLAGYLEAGHVGLVYSYSWIPFILLSVIQIARLPKTKDVILLSISVALLYYSHLPTLIVLTATLGIIFFGALIFKFITVSKKSFLYLIIAGFVAFGLTAISLLPQLESQNSSTRYLLLKNPDVYPKWNSKFEPLKIALIPWVNGINNLRKIDTEKWIALGVFTTILSLFGFIKLKRRTQIGLVILLGILILVILNNASPIYSILLNQKWYLLLRVSTRFWIVVQFIALYLSGIALESIYPYKKKLVIYTIAILAIIESVFFGWTFLQKTPTKNSGLAPSEVYEYIASDKSVFRVFCLTRCLSQKESSIRNLQLLDGYSTLQLKNFNNQSWQLTGSYWNYYTLSIPPIGTYLHEKLKPDIKSLGEYNVKYIISPYKLTDPNLIFKKNIQEYNIYENKLLRPRAYSNSTLISKKSDISLISFAPNIIDVDTSKATSSQLILSEVYSKGWKAYLNGKEMVIIQEAPNALRAVDIKPDTKQVVFKYFPSSFIYGIILTCATIFIISVIGFFGTRNRTGRM